MLRRITTGSTSTPEKIDSPSPENSTDITHSIKREQHEIDRESPSLRSEIIAA